MHKVILQTDLNKLKLLKRGKVRDIYDFNDYLLIIATDRISAFDVILPNGIPEKGRVLTSISLFWFRQMEDIIRNHLYSAKVEDFPDVCSEYRDTIEGRSMLVKKTKPLPIECIVRGYLSGSGWKEYKGNNTICGIGLPEGLKESDKLPEPIFTPSTKAEEGHDINITFKHAQKLVGKEIAEKLREISLNIYRKALSISEKNGIIIADTKFEFGIEDSEIILIDEILTPDSSRFWSMNVYTPEKSQDSFDKQIVRDYLLTLDWDKTYPGPELPDEIVDKTSKRYKEILRILTGE